MEIERAEKAVTLLAKRKQLLDEKEFLEKFKPSLLVRDANGREVLVENEAGLEIIKILLDRKQLEIIDVEQKIADL